MVAGIRVEGAEGYAELSRALRSMSPKARQLMRDEVGAAVKPLVPALRAAVMGIESKAQGSSNMARTVKMLSAGKKEVSADRAEKTLGKSGLRAAVARSIRIVQKDNGYADQVGVFVKSEPSRSLPADQRRLPRYMNRGRWRHPVYKRPGGPDVWVTQTVTPPGWFTRTAEQQGPMVRRRVARIMHKYQQVLARSLRRAA